MDIEGHHGAHAGGNNPPGQGAAHKPENAQQEYGLTGKLSRVTQYIQYGVAGNHETDKEDDAADQ